MLRRLVQLAALGAAGFFVWNAQLEAGGPDDAGAPDPRPPERERPRDAPLLGAEDAPRPASPREERAKRELEARVLREARSDQVVTTDGRVLEGRVVADSGPAIRLLQSFAGAGQMEVSVPRSEVSEVVRNASDPPPISLRDVRFELEFPDFYFYRRPPFTIVSDQDYFRVEDAVTILEELHVDFTHAFAELIARPERNDGIQLLFFSKERQFADYRKRYASQISYALGFYSLTKDRLVVFDQKNAKWARRANRELDRAKAANYRVAELHGNTRSLERWHRAAQGSIRSEAERVNRAVLRHEGAHQLFFTYGVHSAYGAEHPWLVEGLATLFEEGPAGEERAAEARHFGRRSTFAELVNTESPQAFAGQAGNEDEVGAAYAQSWFTVQHLMRNHRDGFFDYIRFVRDPANRDELSRTPRFGRLGRFVGLAPRELERELQQAYARL